MDVTDAELEAALRANRWELGLAADALGISRASVYLLIDRHPTLRTARDVPREEIVRAHRELGGDAARMAERLEVSELGLRRRLSELGLV